MKHRDYSQILIFSALLVTVARYIGAFVASDLGSITGQVSEGITILMGLTGVGMGILDVLGGAYIFDGWRRALPKAGHRWSFRFKVLTFFVFSLVGWGIAILVPFTVSRVTHQTMSQVLGTGWALWGWSFAVNLAPYLLIGGVVSSQSGVVTVDHSETRRPKVRQIPESRPQLSGGNVASNGRNHSENAGILPAETFQDWRNVPDEDRALIAKMSSRKIAEVYGLAPRTARNWRRAAIEWIEEQQTQEGEQ